MSSFKCKLAEYTEHFFVCCGCGTPDLAKVKRLPQLTPSSLSEDPARGRASLHHPYHNGHCLPKSVYFQAVFLVYWRQRKTKQKRGRKRTLLVALSKGGQGCLMFTPVCNLMAVIVLSYLLSHFLPISHTLSVFVIICVLMVHFPDFFSLQKILSFCVCQVSFCCCGSCRAARRW